MVTVHHFRVFSIMLGCNVIRPHKMTADAIKAANGGIVPGTAEELDPSTLDQHGRYYPLQFGTQRIPVHPR
jgi:hypothetical protein